MRVASAGATNLQESAQAQESFVVPHHLHPPTGDLHHHDLLPGPIPIPLLQYLGRNHVGDLLPIMEEVEVHHLQEDLQASDQGRMRELELSRLAAKQKRSLEKLPVAMVTNLL